MKLRSVAMSKLIFMCLFICFQSVVSEICSNSSEIQCFCNQVTDWETGLPQVRADCSVMNIESIPDRIESDLNFLDLTGNNIRVLDPKLQKLSSSNLNVLILKLNQISKVDSEFFLALPNLSELDLSDNYITSLDHQIFQNQNNLHRLDLSYNRIETLPDKIFQSMGKLRDLDLSYNHLGNTLRRAGTFTGRLGVTPNLTHLGLNGLNITVLPSDAFDGFKKLVSLHLADNNFTDIPNVPYSLEKLDLSLNRFTYLSAKYLNYPSLKTLELNGLPFLRSIHHYAFYNLYALEKLTIRYCPNLEEFSELAFDVVSKDTSHKHFKFLSLEGNGLRTLNASYKAFFRQMNHVDLRHNPWRCDCDILWIQEFSTILYKQDEIR
nr:leucine-rich repeat neuronal protein 1-like [Leptinotarsa decemlineata]